MPLLAHVILRRRKAPSRRTHDGDAASRRGPFGWSSIAPAAAPWYFSRRAFVRGVMIHHLSIAARDPKQAAGVLAELMGGKAVPFPPNPGSFFALQLDDHGSGVEVYPAGTELQPNGEVGGAFVKHPRGPRHRSPPWHL